ncbi:MAG TPA: substrate-binding domain-containing protein, partial [Burkholderiales bacterium]|nr:substrate-binding domain-containing protein [Burkholderiales bacterium]
GSRIRGVHDLARPGVRFINRHMDISVAEAVADGRADAGFGLRAEATRLKLAFVPLARERYFFACAKVGLRGSGIKALLDALRGERFAAAVKKLPGYDGSQSAHLEPLDAALTWVERRRPA